MPDNTEVQFVVNQGTNQFFLPAVLTKNGIAHLNLVLAYSGLIEITARCEEAASLPLKLEIIPPITTIPKSSTETPTILPIIEDTPIPTPLPIISDGEPGDNTTPSNNLLVWTISMLIIISIGWGFFVFKWV